MNPRAQVSNSMEACKKLPQINSFFIKLRLANPNGNHRDVGLAYDPPILTLILLFSHKFLCQLTIPI